MVERIPMRRHLLIAKLLFFCGSMGTVGWTRFQSIFYLHNGLNAAQIGTLKSVGLILKFVGEPLWCIIADMTDQKAIFSLCILMQVFTMEILRWVSLNFETIMTVKILRTTTAPSSTFTTTASFALTKGSSEGYGQQRMFGSLAWGGGALIVGYLIDIYGMESIFWYTYFFHICSFALVFFGIPSHIFRKEPKDKHSPNPADPDCKDALEAELDNSKEEDENVTSKDSLLFSADTKSNMMASYANTSQHLATCVDACTKYFAEFQSFLKNIPCRIILMNALLYGLSMNVVDNYLFLSLENDFHTTRTFNGLCTTISTLSCLPLFWYSDALIKKFGHHKMILIPQYVLFVRVLIYAVLGPSWYFSVYAIACVQLIHGFNFALFWASSVDAIKMLAPPGLRASSMATLNIMFFTLAGVFGNISWGIIYDLYGISYVYLGAALTLAVNITYFGGYASVVKDALSDATDE